MVQNPKKLVVYQKALQLAIDVGNNLKKKKADYRLKQQLKSAL